MINVPTTWQCPNCGEQHREEFEVCWKCGTNLVGQRDPGFRISEPVRERDQMPESPPDSQELPILQLPLITYFSIPPLMCYSLFTTHKFLEQLDSMHKSIELFDSTQLPGFRFSLADIAVYCIAMVLIVIPGMVTVVRAEIYRIVHRHKFSSHASEIKWNLSMYRFPESMKRSYGWFVPIYYGSVAAWVIMLFVLLAWHFFRMT